jgi:replicative DNA helicase
MTLNSLSSYGANFQIKVISCLLKDNKFLININDALDEEYFDNSSNKWIVQQIKKYFTQYHTFPTMEVLKIELKKIDNDVLQISVKEQLKEAYTCDGEDSEYVKSEFLNFCKNQQLKKALLNSVDLLKAADYDSIRSLINNALKSGQSKDIGLDYKKDVETRYREDNRSPIPFPWKIFNKITQGGYGKGDLVLVFGNPGGGKSWVIAAMAVEAARLGKKVVIYALELGEEYVGKRLDSILTGIPVDEISESKHRELIEKAMSELPGEIIIKKYAPKRASLDTIENHQRQLKDDGFDTDVMFIDYLDLLKNRKSRKERKDDIDDVYTDAKGLAVELDIPIISPSQANRSGAEKEILESTHIAGSFDKIMIGDIVMSLARGRKDKLKGTGRFHFMKNRYGIDGITFSSKIDTAIGHIEVDEEPLDDNYIPIPNDKKDNSLVNDDEKDFLKKKFFEFDKTKS